MSNCYPCSLTFDEDPINCWQYQILLNLYLIITKVVAVDAGKDSTKLQNIGLSVLLLKPKLTVIPVLLVPDFSDGTGCNNLEKTGRYNSVDRLAFSLTATI